MKKEAETLLRFYSKFGEDSQSMLNFASNEANQRKIRSILEIDEEESEYQHEYRPIDTMPDGVYFIKENNDHYHYEYPEQAAPAGTCRIGIKMGWQAFGISLRDLASGHEDSHQLIPSTNMSPEACDRYSDNRQEGKARFNAFEDVDSIGNTRALMQTGCEVPLPDGEWIPCLAELGIMMMHAEELNEALEKAGGQPLGGIYWSSTEQNKHYAWFADLTMGGVSSAFKEERLHIRTVTDF